MNTQILADHHAKIHPTAIIYDGAVIGENVEIGAYSIIYSNVKIGNNTKIHAHVIIQGNTEIGENNEIFSFCSIGSVPQDKKYKGENSKVIIGNNNIIREYTTVNPGTEAGTMVTSIGNDCWIMMNVHIAHDCRIGNNVTIANHATFAGHVIVEDFANIGGLVGVHQYVRIGAYAMVGFMSAIEKDIIPYSLVKGDRAYLSGINIVGMKRRNFDRQQINSLLDMYDHLFSPNSQVGFDERIEKVKADLYSCEPVRHVVDFLENGRDRAVCKPKNEA